jgi:hypothetical protein
LVINIIHKRRDDWTNEWYKISISDCLVHSEKLIFESEGAFLISEVDGKIRVTWRDVDQLVLEDHEQESSNHIDLIVAGKSDYLIVWEEYEQDAELCDISNRKNDWINASVKTSLFHSGSLINCTKNV